MWAVALLIGIPSAWRNPTSAALVIGWAVSEGIYLITGDGLAIEFYPFLDVFVLAVILAKVEHCNLRPYRSIWHCLACVLLERSPADRFIMLTYLLVWPLYVVPIDPFYQYWGLWIIAVAQFLAAGCESVSISRRRKSRTPIIDLHLMMASLFQSCAAERNLSVTANGGGGDG